MSFRYNETCPYCETEFTVEFENEDDILVHCPACGEALPDYEEDDYEDDWEEED